jgi:hypothetical protein
MKSDYDRWETEKLYLFTGYGWRYPENNKPKENHFYTKEEAIEFEKSSKYAPKEDFDWNNDDKVNELLHENEFYDYEYYWNNYCEEYETFEDEMTTPNGEKVVTFGYYGYDG